MFWWQKQNEKSVLPAIRNVQLFRALDFSRHPNNTTYKKAILSSMQRRLHTLANNPHGCTLVIIAVPQKTPRSLSFTSTVALLEEGPESSLRNLRQCQQSHRLPIKTKAQSKVKLEGMQTHLLGTHVVCAGCWPWNIPSVCVISFKAIGSYPICINDGQCITSTLLSEIRSV